MSFLKTFILLAALGLATLTGSALAQNVPSGPVQFPAPVATGTPAAPPASALPQTSNSSANTASENDIRDIRGPISIPYAWLWLAYVAGALALAAALYAAWRWLRRQATARAKLPFEIALERLETARALMTESTVREYAFAVSEIIRVYIEQRFNEKAAHRTTEEFLSDLLQQTGTPLAQRRDLLEDFLHHCDLLKFARWQLSVPELESMHESARAFVLETRPLPEPAQSKETLPASALPPVPAQPELIESK